LDPDSDAVWLNQYTSKSHDGEMRLKKCLTLRSRMCKSNGFSLTVYINVILLRYSIKTASHTGYSRAFGNIVTCLIRRMLPFRENLVAKLLNLK